MKSAIKQNRRESDMEKQFILRPDYPVVETKAGRLRGYVFDGVFRFFGIKYADAKRFQMPHPVEKWEGIKDAQDYGYNCHEREFFQNDGTFCGNR